MLLNKLNRLLKLTVISLGFSLISCTTVAPIAIEIPSRPMLENCPMYPDITGKIAHLDANTQVVILAYEDAVALSKWGHDYHVCAQSHEVILHGHIDKLENRLKALSER